MSPHKEQLERLCCVLLCKLLRQSWPPGVLKPKLPTKTPGRTLTMMYCPGDRSKPRTGAKLGFAKAAPRNWGDRWLRCRRRCTSRGHPSQHCRKHPRREEPSPRKIRIPSPAFLLKCPSRPSLIPDGDFGHNPRIFQGHRLRGRHEPPREVVNRSRLQRSCARLRSIIC